MIAPLLFRREKMATESTKSSIVLLAFRQSWLHRKITFLVVLIIANFFTLLYAPSSRSFAASLIYISQIVTFAILCFYAIAQLIQLFFQLPNHITHPHREQFEMSMSAWQLLWCAGATAGSAASIFFGFAMLASCLAIIFFGNLKNDSLANRVVFGLHLAWSSLGVAATLVYVYDVEIFHVESLVYGAGIISLVISVLALARKKIVLPITMALLLFSLWNELFASNPHIAAFALSLSLFMFWCTVVSCVRVGKSAF